MQKRAVRFIEPGMKCCKICCNDKTVDSFEYGYHSRCPTLICNNCYPMVVKCWLSGIPTAQVKAAIQDGTMYSLIAAIDEKNQQPANALYVRQACIHILLYLCACVAPGIAGISLPKSCLSEELASGNLITCQPCAMREALDFMCMNRLATTSFFSQHVTSAHDSVQHTFQQSHGTAVAATFKWPQRFMWRRMDRSTTCWLQTFRPPTLSQSNVSQTVAVLFPRRFKGTLNRKVTNQSMWNKAPVVMHAQMQSALSQASVQGALFLILHENNSRLQQQITTRLMVVGLLQTAGSLLMGVCWRLQSWQIAMTGGQRLGQWQERKHNLKMQTLAWKAETMALQIQVAE